MGERAFDESASPDDLALMARELRDALRAGAIGFSTSRTPNHATADDRPVASRLSDWAEVRALVGVMADLGAGIFEIANENSARVRDPQVRREYFDRLRDLAVESGRPVTFGIIATRPDGADWRDLLDLLDETGAAGGRMIGQAHAREFSVVLSFKTTTPFDSLPEWAELRALPLEEQRRALSDPEVRAMLVKAATEGTYARGIGAEARKPDFDHIKVVTGPMPPWRSVAEVAAERGMGPVELMIDLAVSSNFEQLFFQVIANQDQEAILSIMRHPRTVTTFSDSGAHVSQLMDSSIQTHLLGYWARERQAFTLEEAVRMLTLETASAWGFHDRGMVREGMAADLNVIDPATVAPLLPEVRWDLPGGSRRLVQKATGIRATVVNGEVLLADGEHTGALPGQLLRGPLARR
jgi:N-acyl-D-amino-acid deacylase